MPAAPLLAVGYVAGGALAAWLGGPWWLSAFLALLAVIALRAHAQPRRTLLLGVAVVAQAGAGHARYGAAEAARPDLVGQRGTHKVTGRVTEAPRLSGSTSRFSLAVRTRDGQAASGRLRVMTRADLDVTPPKPGDLVTLEGEIEPSSIRPDEASVAFPRWHVICHEAAPWPAAAISAVRAWSLANVERSFPEPHAALASGILIGEQGTLPSSLRDALRITGTTHLVVVSGQNIAIVLGAAVALLSAFLPRRRAGLVVLLLLPAYVVLVGASPPVLRAAAMAVGVAIATAAGRRTPAWVFLAYALAVMVAAAPLLISDISFQLSAAATAGVLLIAPPLTDAIVAPLMDRTWGRGILAALVEAALVAVAAAIAVLPVQAAAFGTASLVQVPANAAVSVVYEGTLALAALAALLGWLPPVALLIREAGQAVPGAFIATVEGFARVPSAAVPLHLAAPAVIAWCTGIAALLWALSRRPRGSRALSVRATLPARSLALLVVAGGLWMAVLTPPDPLPSVTVLDVGQGLAVLVRDRGHSVLIDAGPPDAAVLAALARAGHRGALDVLVLTHDDIDHIGGAAEVVNRVGARRVLGAPHIPAHRADGLQPIDIGDRVRLSEQTQIEVLAPASRTPALAGSDNDAGLVLMVTVGQRRILLPADIEAATERSLIRRGHALRADANVVPHHGSKTSSTTEFIAAVTPGLAVVSVGARNPYGHPVPEVMARYAGAAMYRTDEAGDVTIRTDGTRMWVHTLRDAEVAHGTPRATVAP